MSIIENEYGRFIRVDISLGSSKKKAIDYYTALIDMLKYYVQNSPVVVIIAQYVKHMPLYVYIKHMKKLPKDSPKYETINDANVTFTYAGVDDDHNYDDLYGIVNGGEKYKIIDTEESIECFKELMNKNLVDNKESLIWFISKYLYNSLRGISGYDLIDMNFNQYYTIEIDNLIYSICIVPKNQDLLFNDKFDIVLQKHQKGHPGNYHLDKIPTVFGHNFINNMYFMFNFSRDCIFHNKGIEFLHPCLANIIKEKFSEFYKLEAKQKVIVIQDYVLYIQYSDFKGNEVGCVDDGCAEIIDLPPKIDNYFIFVKQLKFKTDYSDFPESVTLSIELI
jgi:hypothetical protein